MYVSGWASKENKLSFEITLCAQICSLSWCAKYKCSSSALDKYYVKSALCQTWNTGLFRCIIRDVYKDAAHRLFCNNVSASNREINVANMYFELHIVNNESYLSFTIKENV